MLGFDKFFAIAFFLAYVYVAIFWQPPKGPSAEMVGDGQYELPLVMPKARRGVTYPTYPYGAWVRPGLNKGVTG